MRLPKTSKRYSERNAAVMQDYGEETLAVIRAEFGEKPFRRKALIAAFCDSFPLSGSTVRSYIALILPELVDVGVVSKTGHSFRLETTEPAQMFPDLRVPGWLLSRETVVSLQETARETGKGFYEVGVDVPADLRRFSDDLNALLEVHDSVVYLEGLPDAN